MTACGSRGVQKIGPSWRVKIIHAGAQLSTRMYSSLETAAKAYDRCACLWQCIAQ
jgi:hypothetical protein